MLSGKISALSAVCCRCCCFPQTNNHSKWSLRDICQVRDLRETPLSPPGTCRGGGKGFWQLQHLPHSLSARGAYFPSRYSEQVSLSLGKARRRQPICSQRRALPERVVLPELGPKLREGPRAGGSARAPAEQGQGDGARRLAPEMAPPS